jgi:hypothetical protein
LQNRPLFLVFAHPPTPSKPPSHAPAEAERLLAEWGRNELEEKSTPKWLVYLKGLWGPMPVMIWIAAIVERECGGRADGKRHSDGSPRICGEGSEPCTRLPQPLSLLTRTPLC